MFKFLFKNSLTKWKQAGEDFIAADNKARQAEKAMEKASEKHRSRYPLNEETVDAILAAFVQGNPLCCEKGIDTLMGIGIDVCWTEHLNDWAYEYLGCTDSDQPGGFNYEPSLKTLRHKLKECV